MLYLTGVDGEHARSLLDDPDVGPYLGLMIQPSTIAHAPAIPRYGAWAYDNGAYGSKPFCPVAWFDHLSMLLSTYSDTHLFAVAPDVVGDWARTWERTEVWIQPMRKIGARVAVVLQDGATPANVPWDKFDACFIGGTTDWKLGEEAAQCVWIAHAYGMLVHVGRVNTIKRAKYFRKMAVDSIDGTMLKFHPAEQSRILTQLLTMANEPRTRETQELTDPMKHWCAHAPKGRE